VVISLDNAHMCHIKRRLYGQNVSLLKRSKLFSPCQPSVTNEYVVKLECDSMASLYLHSETRLSSSCLRRHIYLPISNLLVLLKLLEILVARLSHCVKTATRIAVGVLGNAVCLSTSAMLRREKNATSCS